MTTDKTNVVKISLEKTEELAQTLTEFELNHGIISADNHTGEVSATNKFKQRLERFGNVAPEAKKISRALRFGTSHEAIDGTAKKRRLERFGAVPHSEEDEQQKKRQRADRFHLNNQTPPVNGDAKKKRIDRFGAVTSSTSKTTQATPVLSDVIQTRTQRFGATSQSAKATTLKEQKIKRAQRFKSMTSS